MVTKAAVIGIDIGADSSYVGFVSKGVVDIVQNEVSSRKTPTLVSYTDRERLLGDAALATIKSNAKNTCRNMKHLVGRKLDAPDLEIEKFWSTCPLAEDKEGFAGYDVTHKGERQVVSGSTAIAAYLTKLREITEAWCQAKVADVVINVPSYFSDEQRQALLDAADIAGLTVLRIMNEHTATALAYGIYRSNDFDPEKPTNTVFCHMGHSLFSVCVASFVKGKLSIVTEAHDKVGGRDMDECLMREFAKQFEKKYGQDPLATKKGMLKIEDAVTKTKKVLSANAEAPVNVECWVEDYDFASMMQRSDFEEMCKPMMDRVQTVLNKAKEACGLKEEDIHFVEMCGGASRVPWLKDMCSKTWYGKDLQFTLNADECVARGCTLQAAILSPLFKVRDFKVEDTSPFGISVGWMGTAAEGEKEEDGDAPVPQGEGEWKTATVFPANSSMNLLKMLTFYRKGPFEIKAQYVDTEGLLPGTKNSLGTFTVDLPPQTENKRIKVKAKLTLHGTFTLEGAQMVEEEEYEETVKEKRELPPDPVAEESAKEGETAPAAEEGKDEPTSPDANGTATEGEGDKENEVNKDADKAKETKKEPEKKYEWVDVKKTKKRTKKTDVTIIASGKPGLGDAMIQVRKDKEFAIQAEMKEIVETDVARNDLEAYILTMRDKISEGSVYGEYISSADRDSFNSALMAGEDWLYDHFEAAKVEYVDKLNELKKLGNPVVWRHTENTTRDEWIAAVKGTVTNYRTAAENPGDKYGHIAADKLGSIVEECNDTEAWLNDLVGKQAKMAKTDKPVLLCADMEKKNSALAQMADKILAEKKPEPPKEKKEEKKDDSEKPAEGAEPAAAEGASAPPADGPENMDVD